MEPASSSSSTPQAPIIISPCTTRKTSISDSSIDSPTLTQLQKSQLPLPLRTQPANITSTQFRSVSSAEPQRPSAAGCRTLSRKPSSTKTQLPTGKNSNSNFNKSSARPITTNGQPTDQVTMLKEQLAKLQSELRIARGQVATLDNQLTRSKTPPSKTPPFGSSLNSTHRLQQQQQQQQSSSSSSSRPATPSRSPKSRKKSNSASKSHSLRKSSSSANSEPTDGLSIRFISGPGIHSSRSPQPSSIMDDSSLPISDSGYIKDPDGVWVPLNSPPTHSPSRNLSGSARYKSPSPSEAPRGISRIPISAVALGRVLAGDPLVPDHQSIQADIAEEQEPTEDHCGSVPRNSEYSSGASLSSPQIDDQNTTASTEPPGGSHPPAVSRQPRGNPFFSSGGGRDRGAMIHQNSSADRTTNGGNTGKVITTLQSDLLYARTALDQSKSQLRLSQRAVESLNRQTEDLKESMSRLRLENEGLSKMLSRKERTVSELMDRLKRSEAELSTLKQEKKELDVNFKKISKETDEVVKDSVRRRDRAETQYEAVRSGVKSLSEGWKRDVTTLKQDICRLEEKHRKEMEDSRLKYNTLAKLHASRSGALSRIETDLTNLQSSKEGFIAKYTSELSGLRAHLEEEEKKSSQGLQLAREVSDECARFKRILRHHSTGSSAAPGPPPPKLKP